MRIEFCLLALLVVAAFWGLRRAKLVERQDKDTIPAAKTLAKTTDDRCHYLEVFCKSYARLLYDMAALLNTASGQLHETKKWRERAEDCSRGIEWALAEQDKIGLVTSGSELEVISRRQCIDGYETAFIKSQQRVHLAVEKVREHAFNLQTLSQQLRDSVGDKSEQMQESAGVLCSWSDNEAKVVFDFTERMLVEADKDPVGINENFVTPKVMEFRKERSEARSKIRTNLATQAQ